jgi:hypothetical protein
LKQNAGDCTDTSTLAVQVTGIDNPVTAGDQVYLYPNPATDELFIITGSQPAEQIDIYNCMGSLISQTKQPGTNRIDISNLAAGLYIAEIKLGTVTVQRRWVKL